MKKEASVFIATSLGKSMLVHGDYMLGCIEASHAFPKLLDHLPGAMPELQSGLYVSENRDILTKIFLDVAADYMLSVDTDIGWRAIDAKRLIETGKDVVSGTYHLQDGSGTPAGTDMDGGNQTDGELKRAIVVPAGFLLISRRVMLRLMADRPADVYAVEGHGIVPALWTEVYRPGQPSYRDDAAFSHHCLQAGIELWRHTGVIVRHHGAAVY